ncbi:MAG: hypothetical protein WDN47_02645 [Candidatus Doudnabacteria bacterium]
MKRKGKNVATEADLEADDASQSHRRKQTALNAVNNVLICVIYVLPAIVLLWAIIMAYHFISIGDWDGLSKTGLTLATHATAYFIGIIQKNKWLED